MVVDCAVVVDWVVVVDCAVVVVDERVVISDIVVVDTKLRSYVGDVVFLLIVLLWIKKLLL